jgi:hypothetical protein
MNNENSGKGNLEDSGINIFFLSVFLMGAMAVVFLPGIIGTDNMKFNFFISYLIIILCIFFSNNIKIDFCNFSEVKSALNTLDNTLKYSTLFFFTIFILEAIFISLNIDVIVCRR